MPPPGGPWLLGVGKQRGGQYTAGQEQAALKQTAGFSGDQMGPGPWFCFWERFWVHSAGAWPFGGISWHLALWAMCPYRAHYPSLALALGRWAVLGHGPGHSRAGDREAKLRMASGIYIQYATASDREGPGAVHRGPGAGQF